jgi:hypothetical protein
MLILTYHDYIKRLLSKERLLSVSVKHAADRNHSTPLADAPPLFRRMNSTYIRHKHGHLLKVQQHPF